MAGDTDELVKQAVDAFQAGRKAEARSILESVVEQDQNHEEAWLYLSGLVDSLEEQEICLENVLALNPNNQKAQQGIEAIRQKIAAQRPAPPGSTPSTRSKSPGASSSRPIGAEFEMMSGDTPFSDAFDAQAPSGSEPAPGSPSTSDETVDWFSGSAEPDAPPTNDAYAIPTSVDWGHDDRPATYGSGQDVEMPSAQEWDSWVQGLNITKDTPEAAPPESEDSFGGSASPFVIDDFAPFGETSYMVEDEEASPADQAAPNGASFGDTAYEGASSWPSPFADDGAAEAVSDEDGFTVGGLFAPGDYYEEETAPAQDSFTYETEAVESDEEELVFNFDNDIDDESGTGAAALSARPGAEYFRLIPGEIEARGGGIERNSLLLIGGIVVLAILNVISFALLL